MNTIMKLVVALSLAGSSLAPTLATASSCPQTPPSSGPVIPFFGLSGPLNCAFDVEVYALRENCVSYSWSLLLDPNDPISLGNRDYAEFTVPEPGTYTIRLQRSNQFGSNVIHQNIDVQCDGGGFFGF